MNNWAQQVAQAEATAQSLQASEAVAEGRFDEAHALAQSRAADATGTEEFRAWMAARHATDAAWGAWSVVMDAKP